MQSTETPTRAADPDIVPLRGAPLPAEQRRPQRVATPAASPATVAWPGQRARRRFGGLLGLSALIVIGLPTLLGIIYFGFVAADQYVTQVKFTVRGPQQVPQSKDTLSSLTGMPGGGGLQTMQDAIVITEFINSRQGYQDVQQHVDVRRLFSDPSADFIARLDPAVPIERMERYWSKMVEARLDQLTGVVTVDVRAFTPQASLKLAEGVLKSADNMVNTLNAQAESDLVKQASEDLDRAEERWRAAQAELLRYQQEFQILDPGKAVDAVATISADLFAQLNQLKTQYATMSAYMAPNSAQVQMLREQIKALEAQIPKVGETAPDTRALGRNVAPQALAKFQSIQLHANFAAQALTQALNALVRAHEMAAERQVYLAIFVQPSLAESSLYPDRPAAILITFLAAAAVWCLSTFILYTVRDHLS